MSESLTIRIDDDLNDLLNGVSRTTGRTRSDLAREALRRQLTLATFEELRQSAMRDAEVAGFRTDDDVFREVS